MKQKNILTIFLLCCYFISIPTNSTPKSFENGNSSHLDLADIADTNRETTLLKARQQLKDYGLIHCLIKTDNTESQLKKELAIIAGAYHFFSNGMHSIKQNEDTFETTYDPYQLINDYFDEHREKHLSGFKHHDRVESSACFNTYHSAAFNALIEQQDSYIEDPSF